jgi:hypothetical protein
MFPHVIDAADGSLFRRLLTGVHLVSSKIGGETHLQPA